MHKAHIKEFLHSPRFIIITGSFTKSEINCLTMAITDRTDVNVHYHIKKLARQLNKPEAIWTLPHKSNFNSTKMFLSTCVASLDCWQLCPASSPSNQYTFSWRSIDELAIYPKIPWKMAKARRCWKYLTLQEAEGHQSALQIIQVSRATTLVFEWPWIACCICFFIQQLLCTAYPAHFPQKPPTHLLSCRPIHTMCSSWVWK